MSIQRNGSLGFRKSIVENRHFMKIIFPSRQTRSRVGQKFKNGDPNECVVVEHL